jgi:hypothetical protein
MCVVRRSGRPEVGELFKERRECGSESAEVSIRFSPLFVVFRSTSFSLLSFFRSSIGDSESIAFKPLDLEISLSEFCFELYLCRLSG